MRARDATYREEPLGCGEVSGNAWFQLDSAGTIREHDTAGGHLFGYKCGELLCRHISQLVPQLAGRTLVVNGRPEPALAHLCHIGRRFMARDCTGRDFAVELFLNVLNDGGTPHVSLIVHPCTIEAANETIHGNQIANSLPLPA